MTYIENVEINCFNCHMTFWITKKHNDELLRTKKLFYCPNGHSRCYTEESDKDKAVREKKRADYLDLRERK